MRALMFSRKVITIFTFTSDSIRARVIEERRVFMSALERVGELWRRRRVSRSLPPSSDITILGNAVVWMDGSPVGA